MDFVLETKGLSKDYRHFKALSGVDMLVPKGSIYGLVGKNGAGKTTLIRIISGLQKKSGGECILFGKEYGKGREDKARRRLGALVESPSIYLDLSAEDNLKMQYTVLGIPSFETIPSILDTVGLSDTGKKKAGSFSLGMKERLGIAMALSGSPDFLILDEPTNGLDPEAMVEMRELILRLNREKGMTIMVSSHILDELSKIATHYGFLDKGRMAREISREELERESRKCVRVKLRTPSSAALVLDSMGLEYTLLDGCTMEIYGDVGVGILLEKLAKCGIEDIEKKNETLEGYFMSILGGEA
ncbi:MAG: ATP-binding cassette domain-containing protein [Candidatus Ornithospirochaeta sp.]